MLVFARAARTNIVPPHFVFPETQSIRFLKENAGNFRIARFGTPLPFLPNFPLVYRIFDAQGTDSFIVKDYGTLFKTFFTQKFYNVINGPLAAKDLNAPLLHFLGVKYILSYTLIFPTPSHLRLLFFHPGEMAVYENKKALPVVRLVNHVVSVKEKPQVLKALTSPHFSPDKEDCSF